MDERLYDRIVQEYLHYEREKRNLTKQRDMITARIDTVDEFLIDLNDVLCKFGEHIYEYFKKNEGVEE